MKIYLPLLLFLLSYSAKADTITTWNVYYNQKLLKRFNANPGVKEIQIKASDYKKGDYLSVEYGDDTPCPECSYELTVVSEGKDQVFTFRTKAKYKLMKIDLKTIIAEFRSSRARNFFVVYLTECNKKKKRDSIIQHQDRLAPPVTESLPIGYLRCQGVNILQHKIFNRGRKQFEIDVKNMPQRTC